MKYALSQSAPIHYRGGVKTLDDEGNRLWPKAGNDATMVFVDASCGCRSSCHGDRRGLRSWSMETWFMADFDRRICMEVEEFEDMVQEREEEHE